MNAATNLMTDLARIQKAMGEKRAASLVAARAKLAGHQWSSEEMTRWARWAWIEGVR
jgi:hypothetical protein